MNIFSLLRRKPKRTHRPAPSWLKWLVVGVVLYAMIASQHKDTPERPNAVRQSLEKMSADVKSSVNISGYKDKLLPVAAHSLDITDVAEGSGNPAVCGQEVKIAYTTFLADGTKTDEEKTLAFRIGEGKALPALEQSVIGLKPGGKLSVVASPDMAGKAAADGSIHFNIELLEVIPALPDLESLPFRITEMKAGSGAAIRCGQEVKAMVTVWSLEGKKIFSTKEPVTFTTGASQIFLGVEQGVIGMLRGGTRTLIVPPAFQKTMRGNRPVVDIALPKTQTVLVDVEVATGN